MKQKLFMMAMMVTMVLTACTADEPGPNPNYENNQDLPMFDYDSTNERE